MSSLGTHAIVIGGSLAGLLAARLLADRFDAVSIIERDELPLDALPRKGVPQGQHAHGLWPRGLQVMERLLPGLRDQLVAGGACAGDVARDFCWHHFGVLKVQADCDMPGLTMTRPFLEATVRRRVLAGPRITLRRGCSVERLLSEGSPARVTGVELRDAQGLPHHLGAALVVDASGRGSRLPIWLEQLGYQAPAESALRIDVGYASAFFERRASDAQIGHVIVQTPPQGRRAAVALAVEGGRWLVTMVGFVGERARADHVGFIEYARSLPHPGVAEIVSRAAPLSEVQTYRFATSLRRHYEKLAEFPHGLLALGDAICSFNPAYGQGMTVAASEIDALQTLLAQTTTLDGLALRFFRAAAPLIDIPWTLTSGEDWRYPQVPGRRPLVLPLLNAYVTRLHRAAGRDAAVAKAFFEVAGLQKPPPSLFAPRVAWSVLWHGGIAATSSAQPAGLANAEAD